VDSQPENLSNRFRAKCSVQSIALGSLAAILVLGLHSSLPQIQPHPNVFGWEYGNIAQNLAEGRGFSGPFGPSHAPTAWMPPLLPIVVAFVFLTLGVNTWVSALALLTLQALWTWLSLLLLLRLPSSRNQKALFSLIFISYVCLNWGMLLFEFHDTSFIMVLSSMALLSLHHLREKKLFLPLVTAAVLPLSSPPLAVAFCLAAVIGRLERKRLFSLIGVMLLTTSLWTIRNAIAMRAFVPLKSNLFFELYQANVADQDGIPQTSTFVLYHPITGFNETKTLYDQKGEIEFLAGYKDLSLEPLSKNPTIYLRKVGTRVFNAFVYLKPVSDLVWDYSGWRDDLLTELVQQRLIGPNRPPVIWCSLQLSANELSARIRHLDPRDQEQTIQSWNRAQYILYHRDHLWNIELWRLAHALFPTLAIIIGLSRRRTRSHPVFKDACSLYLIYLIPYVLISHYVRYQVPLMGLSAYLISCAVAPGTSQQARKQGDPNDPDLQTDSAQLIALGVAHENVGEQKS
jgi:hypothetical protein